MCVRLPSFLCFLRHRPVLPPAPARLPWALLQKRRGPQLSSPSPSVSDWHLPSYRHPCASSPHPIFENTLGSPSHSGCAFPAPLLSPAPTWPSVLLLTFPGSCTRALVPPAPPLLPFSRGAVLPPRLRLSPTPTVPLGDRMPHFPPYRLCRGRGLGGAQVGRREGAKEKPACGPWEQGALAEMPTRLGVQWTVFPCSRRWAGLLGS